MKVVNNLDKKSRRKFIWRDSEGALWFWDTDHDDWYTLTPEQGGYYVSDTVETDGWPDGPFTKVSKNPVFETGL